MTDTLPPGFRFVGASFPHGKPKTWIAPGLTPEQEGRVRSELEKAMASKRRGEKEQ